jgi:hypothetical protein
MQFGFGESAAIFRKIDEVFSETVVPNCQTIRRFISEDRNLDFTAMRIEVPTFV